LQLRHSIRQIMGLSKSNMMYRKFLPKNRGRTRNKLWAE
jgi:hypothetical protein